MSEDDTYLLRASSFHHRSDVRGVAAAPGGTHVFSASRDGTAAVLEVPADGDTLAAGVVCRGHSGFVNCVLFHPGMAALGGEAALVTGGGQDRHVAAWSLATGEVLAVMDGHSDGVRCIALLRPSLDVVTGGWDGRCVVWDAATARPRLATNATIHTTSVLCVAQLPGTDSVVSGSGDKTLQRWSAATGRKEVSFAGGHTDAVQCVVALSADAFVSGSNDGRLVQWHAGSGARLRVVEAAHNAMVYALAFNARTGELLSGGEDRTLRVWRGFAAPVTSGSAAAGDVVLAQSINHPAVVWSVALLDDGAGDDVVTGSSDGAVRVWTRDDGRMAGADALVALETAVAAQTHDAKSIAAVPALAAQLADLAALPAADAELPLLRGAREGELRLARGPPPTAGASVLAALLLGREGGGGENADDAEMTVELHAWNRGRWDMLGIVVEGPERRPYTGKPRPREKKFHNGKYYDYVFDIALGEQTLHLAYNRGESIFDAAQRFIDDHAHLGVSQDHKEQLQQHILDGIDPADAALLGAGSGGGGASRATAAGGGSTAAADAAKSAAFSQFAKEAEEMRARGAAAARSWGEHMRELEARGGAVAFSTYAQEGQQAAAAAAAASATAAAFATGGTGATSAATAGVERAEVFAVLNAEGAKQKLRELTGGSDFDAAVAAAAAVVAEGAAATQAAAVDAATSAVALHETLPEGARFPAVDLLRHLLSSAAPGVADAVATDAFETIVAAMAAATPAAATDPTRLVALRLAANALARAAPNGVRRLLFEAAPGRAALVALVRASLRSANANIRAAFLAVLGNAALAIAAAAASDDESSGAADAAGDVVALVGEALLYERDAAQIRRLLAPAVTLKRRAADGSGGAAVAALAAAVAAAVARAMSVTLQRFKNGGDSELRAAALLLLN